MVVLNENNVDFGALSVLRSRLMMEDIKRKIIVQPQYSVWRLIQEREEKEKGCLGMRRELRAKGCISVLVLGMYKKEKK